MQRILLIQLKRIGDFILTAPAVQALRAAYPAAEIVLMAQKNVAGLAACLRDVNRVIAYETGASNLEAWTSAMAGAWDLCLDFTGTDRSALITSLTRAERRIGYAKFSGRSLRRMAFTQLSAASVRDLHTVDLHLALVEEALSSTPQRAFDSQAFQIPEKLHARSQGLLAAHGVSGPFVIVHPGTAREEKFWLDERWAEVIHACHEEKRLPVLLTGGGDGLEKPHLDALRQMLRVPVVDLTGKLSLVELLSLISRCELILGVDSMAMHMASVFKRPQVALFGPTNPLHWRPRHERSLVVTPDELRHAGSVQASSRKLTMNHISTESVLNAMRALLSPP